MTAGEIQCSRVVTLFEIWAWKQTKRGSNVKVAPPSNHTMWSSETYFQLQRPNIKPVSLESMADPNFLPSSENPMENPNGKIHHESSGCSHHVPGITMGLNHLRSCSFGLCLWTAEDHRTWELPAGLAMEVSFAGGIGIRELIFQDFPARHV
jgi:hypothetical protein